MPRKKPAEQPIAKDDPDRIIPMTMEDVMHNSMIPYAEHVILERALPRVEDGLKPVQRRILYTMMELGTTPDKPHRKCARIVGDCLGKYHPHGDSSVYDALVRMAQGFVMRGPMVDGHGNFGSIDGDSAAAMRYTEARMAPLAMLMLRDIEKDTVPFRLNFDDTLKEPDMLPARFPNLLVNGASGIAVGLATNIPPHNLGEAIRATIAQIENPEITLDELMEIIPGPDFPTGGVLVKNDEIRLGYETGRSKLSVRARVHMEDASQGRKLIVITEIPYQVNKAQMLAKIQSLRDEKKAALSGIYDIRDESDRTGLRAVIEVRRDADPDKILAYLYRYSDLQVTFGVNMVAIAEGKPKQMGLKTMIGYFIDHQKDVVTRRTQYDLHQAETRAHVLEGLMIAVDNLDEVIRLIRASKTPKEAREQLMQTFTLDEVQAQAILDMRLQRLTNLEILALRKEFEELQKLIKKLQGILGSEKKLMKVIVDELHEIETSYADERRTSIEAVDDVAIDPSDNTQAPEDVVVALTRGGQLKRMSPSLYRRNPLPTPEEDERESAQFLFHTQTDRLLYIFTDHANCYALKVSAINECKPKDRGQQLAGILSDFEDGEKALHVICQKPDQMGQEPDVLFFTKKGRLKRSHAQDYALRTRKVAAITLKDGDSILRVMQVSSPEAPQDLLVVTALGMYNRLKLEDVPIQGRTTAGSHAIILSGDDDQVLIAEEIPPHSELVLLTERGYGKRVPEQSLSSPDHKPKGYKAFNLNRNKTNGTHLVYCALHTSPQRLMIDQQKSGTSTLLSEEIPVQDTDTRGFPCIMALMEDVLVSVRNEPLETNEAPKGE